MKTINTTMLALGLITLVAGSTSVTAKIIKGPGLQAQNELIQKYVRNQKERLVRSILNGDIAAVSEALDTKMADPFTLHTTKAFCEQINSSECSHIAKKVLKAKEVSPYLLIFISDVSEEVQLKLVELLLMKGVSVDKGVFVETADCCAQLCISEDGVFIETIKRPKIHLSTYRKSIETQAVYNKKESACEFVIQWTNTYLTLINKYQPKVQK